MLKPSEILTANESVWEHRIRQKIALEKIILEVGNPKEQYSAKQFLDAMEKAHPNLFEDIEQYTLELLYSDDMATPELFDEQEYSAAKGRKTALKFPSDIAWEAKIIRRAAREFRDLFHPCEESFRNAMKGLQYLNNIHPKLFEQARELAIEQREQILSCELYCKCGCVDKENRLPAETFAETDHGRLHNISKRISMAKQVLEGSGPSSNIDWQFFLDRVKEMAPEMTS